MSIHPNAPFRPSKSTIADPQDLLMFLLTSEPRPRRRDAEREVIKRFPWWNPWKPGWRPAGFSSENDSERENDGARRASYQARHEEILRQRQHRQRCQREEEARASQSRRGSDERGEGAENLFERGDKAINQWTAKASNSSYDEFLVEDHHTADDAVALLFGALGRMKDERDAAISLISVLIEERSRARAHNAAQHRVTELSNPLYRKVGLHGHCPNHVLAAARKSFRVILHPDKYPAHMREEAERRFKETEAIFDEIRRLRGS